MMSLPKISSWKAFFIPPVLILRRFSLFARRVLVAGNQKRQFSMKHIVNENDRIRIGPGDRSIAVGITGNPLSMICKGRKYIRIRLIADTSAYGRKGIREHRQKEDIAWR
jgi:hypothetical protein